MIALVALGSAAPLTAVEQRRLGLRVTARRDHKTIAPVAEGQKVGPLDGDTRNEWALSVAITPAWLAESRSSSRSHKNFASSLSGRNAVSAAVAHAWARLWSQQKGRQVPAALRRALPAIDG
jgi:hypothetical protein